MRNKRHQRPYGNLQYRRIFLISPEGMVTEPQYFGMFSGKTFTVKVLQNNHKSAPIQVLQKAESYMLKHKLKPGDEVWLIIDRDTWPEKQLESVFSACHKQGFNLALSNPRFEYWLLLHFDNGDGIATGKDCKKRLKRYLPHFEKGHVEIEKLEPFVKDAISRAKQKDTPPCNDWPRTVGTTVYRLIEKMVNCENG